MCCFEFKIMLNLKIHVVGVVFRKNCFKKVFDMFLFASIFFGLL